MKAIEREITRRMQLVIDDAQVIIKHLESGKTLQDDTIHGATIWTHLDNINIAMDMNSQESLKWNLFNKK